MNRDSVGTADIVHIFMCSKIRFLRMKPQSKVHKQKWKGRRRGGRNAKDVEKEWTERSTSK